jgi:3-oxoacyl-[acyl-carrier protein] reductase
MQPDVKRRALVLGGTGFVGSAVLRELARRGVPAAFAFHTSKDKARVLATEFGHTAFHVNLADADATRAALETQDADVVIHCAAVSADVRLAPEAPRSSSQSIAVDPSAFEARESTRPFQLLDDVDEAVAALQHAMAVNVQSAYQLLRWVADRHSASPFGDAAQPGGAGPCRRAPCDVVLVGALDRAQSLPLPAHFAATQGALAALVMAAAHELGPRGIRVNLVALGVLDGGISKSLAARHRRDYETFSALRRAGTADEAARTICWLALENTYIQGKTVSVNGGI